MPSSRALASLPLSRTVGEAGGPGGAVVGPALWDSHCTVGKVELYKPSGWAQPFLCVGHKQKSDVNPSDLGSSHPVKSWLHQVGK